VLTKVVEIWHDSICEEPGHFDSLQEALAPFEVWAGDHTHSFVDCSSQQANVVAVISVLYGFHAGDYRVDDCHNLVIILCLTRFEPETETVTGV